MRMVRGIGSIGVKLLFAGIVGAAALHMSGLTERVPLVATAPPPRPAASAKPPVALATPLPPRADDPFVVKRILALDAPLQHGDYAWNEDGVPPGPIVITVDVAAEMLSVFRGGYEIGAAVILYGATEKPTPLGTFFISQKDAKHVSNLYNAPMPYMMRLTNDGVAIHGSDVLWDAATHGCIGVPKQFAKLLFGQAKIGDRVIVTKGKRLDVGGAIVPA